MVRAELQYLQPSNRVMAMEYSTYWVLFSVWVLLTVNENMYK